MRRVFSCLLIGVLSLGAACGGGKELGEPCDLTAEVADLCKTGFCVAIISCTNGKPPRHRTACAERTCTPQNTCKSGQQSVFDPTRACFCVPAGFCN
jgi:hypothetical protein